MATGSHTAKNFLDWSAEQDAKEQEAKQKAEQEALKRDVVEFEARVLRAFPIEDTDDEPSQDRDWMESEEEFKEEETRVSEFPVVKVAGHEVPGRREWGKSEEEIKEDETGGLKPSPVEGSGPEVPQSREWRRSEEGIKELEREIVRHGYTHLSVSDPLTLTYWEHDEPLSRLNRHKKSAPWMCEVDRQLAEPPDINYKQTIKIDAQNIRRLFIDKDLDFKLRCLQYQTHDFDLETDILQDYKSWAKEMKIHASRGGENERADFFRELETALVDDHCMVAEEGAKHTHGWERTLALQNGSRRYVHADRRGNWYYFDEGEDVWKPEPVVDGPAYEARKQHWIAEARKNKVESYYDSMKKRFYNYDEGKKRWIPEDWQYLTWLEDTHMSYDQEKRMWSASDSAVRTAKAFRKAGLTGAPSEVTSDDEDVHSSSTDGSAKTSALSPPSSSPGLSDGQTQKLQIFAMATRHNKVDNISHNTHADPTNLDEKHTSSERNGISATEGFKLNRDGLIARYLLPIIMRFARPFVRPLAFPFFFLLGIIISFILRLQQHFMQKRTSRTPQTPCS